MNNKLIERVDKELYNLSVWRECLPVRQVLNDCKAEIQLLQAENESLRNQNTEMNYILAELEAKPSIDALIAEIDGLERIDFDEGGCDYPCSDGDNYRFDDVRAVLKKYRGAK